MILTLKRNVFDSDYTEGSLFVDGLFFCDTLEDCYRNLAKEAKQPGRTAIPFGTYYVKLSMSNRFKKIMPQVLNVPHFTGIRIHSGNTAEDSEGCILVGTHLSPGRIASSRDTFMRLMNVLEYAIKTKGETVMLEVQ